MNNFQGYTRVLDATVRSLTMTKTIIKIK